MSGGIVHLDEFFDPAFVTKALELYGFHKENEYPDLEPLLQRYQKLVKSGSYSTGIYKLGETFSKKVRIDDNNYYGLVWSIQLAKLIIRRNKLPLKSLRLENLYRNVDHKNINQNHLNYALHNEAPVILASFPHHVWKDKYLLIDGNHRVTAKYQNGQEEIEGYFLSPAQHLRAMTSNGYRLLYNIHANYHAILSFIGGKMNWNELQETMVSL